MPEPKTKAEAQNLLNELLEQAAGASSAIQEGMIILDTHTLTRIFVSLLQITNEELEEIILRRQGKSRSSDSKRLATEQSHIEPPSKLNPSGKP